MKKKRKNIIFFFLIFCNIISQNFPLKISRISHKFYESRVKVIDERPTSCGYYFVSVYFDDFTHTSDLLNNWRFSMPWTGDGDYNIDDNLKSKIWVGIDDSPISRGEIYCEDGNLIQKLTKLSNSFTAIPYPNSSVNTYSFTTGITNSRFFMREGVFEARIKIPENPHLFPAYWLFSGPTEIDIFEFFDPDVNGGVCDQYHQMKTTIHNHTITINNIKCKRGRKFPVPNNFFDTYHVFKCIWTNYRIDIYLDNTLVLYGTRYYDGPYYPSPPCEKHGESGIPHSTRDCSYMQNAQGCNTYIGWPVNECIIWNKVDKDLGWPTNDNVMRMFINFVIYYLENDYQDDLYSEWNNFDDWNKIMKIDWIRIYQPFNCGLNINVLNENQFKSYSGNTNFLTGHDIKISGNYINEPPKLNNNWHDFPTHILATNEISFNDEVIFEEGTYLRCNILNVCNFNNRISQNSNIIIENEDETLNFIEYNEFDSITKNVLSNNYSVMKNNIFDYPNPANDRFIIDINEEDLSNIYKIELVDIWGRVYYLEISTTQKIDNYKEGFYIVKFYFTNGIIVSKPLIIKR